jgi:hypothetical protein
MRHILIPLICLAVLASSASHGQNADSNAPPLYLKFRVLSGLPWKEPGSTRKTVLERIFQEPHTLARREVLREYLHTALPVEEFPAAFDECVALEQANFPGAMAEFVIRAWAERDPAAAINRCQTLFDLVIEGAPRGFDEWKTPIRVSNLEKARASSYWFGDRGVVHACWKGLAASTLPPERRKELEAEFREAYVRRFQEDLPADIEEPSQVWAIRFQSSYVEHPPTISSDAGMRVEFFRLLGASPEEIPGMLKWPNETPKDITFPRALIRWMNGDGRKAPQILDRILDVYDPRHYYRDDDATMDLVPVEFLVEWAILDRAGFMAWVDGNFHTCGWRAKAVYLTVMPKESEYEVISKTRAFRRNHQEELKSKFDKLWITLDPYNAIPWLSRDGDYSINEALDDLWRSDPPANYWRSVIAAYTNRDRRGGGNEAWGVTMVWARVDFTAMIKQYGLPWCLRSGEYKKSEVPRMFSNRQALENGSGLHNTLSALRTWAILRPKEMRAWIDKETFPPDLREALLWLLDNATGGIGP